MTDLSDSIVGHKTFPDGEGGFRHEPLYASEADKLLAKLEESEQRRIALMPDEKSALRMLFEAWTRLKELGWSEAVYCPKDGREFDAIEIGSTGIHRCSYHGVWPNGTWYIYDHGDLWPLHPILYRKPTDLLKGDSN
jgi:hypothetical protein